MASVVDASHTRAWLSSQRVTMKRPSALQRAERAALSPTFIGESSISPVAASHSLTSPDNPAVIRRAVGTPVEVEESPAVLELRDREFTGLKVADGSLLVVAHAGYALAVWGSSDFTNTTTNDNVLASEPARNQVKQIQMPRPPALVVQLESQQRPAIAVKRLEEIGRAH